MATKQELGKIMQITQQTDYALRVLIYIKINSDRLVNISEIAEKYHISRSHLTKVVANLTKHGYLIGVRGKNGGLRLGKNSEDIVLGELFRVFEPLSLIECHTDHNNCIISPNCRLNSIFGQALTAFMSVLDQYVLEDIVKNVNLQKQLGIDVVVKEL